MSDSAKQELTLVTEKNGIRRIQLNNPKKHHALSLDLLKSLKSAIEKESDGKPPRVIVICSSGKVFSAGHDLRELTDATGHDYHKDIFDACTKVMQLIQDTEVPVIAEVNGLATAAGCQLVASCDVVIASESSRFATPGVNVGLFCSTPAVALARAVPRKLAMQMLLTGEAITAQEALKHGLVSKVVPHEELETETTRIAEKISSSSRSVMALGKACFYKQIQKSRDEAYSYASDAMLRNLNYDDCQEGINAFVDKRQPVWKD
ncbi:uncharacterized protein TRIADDRAFT_27938 [Trichoplax adhaerens]|uniref:Enoyl-CoA hydratase domain-containing protein 3, mitochondrial n=1 Tax=Trichoplax adhaerens TaxID=10228 RepID=B3S2A5_TRIAD|nr:hypothetical protein TRIADDRAFT_27938 [Trichoplax adhaerens]EDV23613.1 hypothetical protein TRIADDRAFT_27938 [Trichoplax adhaerens]|eukprot:XP_002114523.1 hypothetical protein TRIADDRAFT_27938 [Trichoplax adhaerens]